MDWSELNHDILRLIAKKVKNISDFVRLRAVCKTWRSVVHLSDLALQSPNIAKFQKMNNNSLEIKFNQCFSQRVYTVLINNIFQDILSTFWCGSLSGILLFFMPNNSKPWLILNPLTGFQNLLPFEKRSSAHPIYIGHSCEPKAKPHQNDIDVVFMFDSCEVCLWRYYDMEWTRIGTVPVSVKERVTYCNNGILCAVSRETGYARFIDISTGKESVIRSPSMGLAYLVEAGGDLLCVIRTDVLEDLDIHYTGSQFEVHEIEDFGTNPRMRKLNSIGNRVIFLNKNSNALCLNASDCEGYQSNCIYHKAFAISGDTRKLATVRYDIENNKTELNCDSACGSWFVPSLV